MGGRGRGVEPFADLCEVTQRSLCITGLCLLLRRASSEPFAGGAPQRADNPNTAQPRDPLHSPTTRQSAFIQTYLQLTIPHRYLPLHPTDRACPACSPLPVTPQLRFSAAYAIKLSTATAAAPTATIALNRVDAAPLLDGVGMPCALLDDDCAGVEGPVVAVTGAGTTADTDDTDDSKAGAVEDAGAGTTAAVEEGRAAVDEGAVGEGGGGGVLVDSSGPVDDPAEEPAAEERGTGRAEEGAVEEEPARGVAEDCAVEGVGVAAEEGVTKAEAEEAREEKRGLEAPVDDCERTEGVRRRRVASTSRR